MVSIRALIELPILPRPYLNTSRIYLRVFTNVIPALSKKSITLFAGFLVRAGRAQGTQMTTMLSANWGFDLGQQSSRQCNLQHEICYSRVLGSAVRLAEEDERARVPP
jgi:hypothetical protein